MSSIEHTRLNPETLRVPHPLDNVVWNALNTRQVEFSESLEHACRLMPDVGRLAGLDNPNPVAYASLAPLVSATETIGLFLDQPYEDNLGWTLVARAPLLQMVYEDVAPDVATGSNLDVVELGDRDSVEMLELTTLTKPGPFKRNTNKLGTYLGVRSEGRLIAMAGERLKVPGYTEVSAVCTHPGHTGRGYAGRLMSELVGRIRDRGETPFLHVREDNLRAIGLYHRLGFETRVKVHLAVLRKN